MALSIIPLMARMALVHVILRFGTNNAAIPGDLDAEGIRRREIGSKLVLASRIMYAALYVTLLQDLYSHFLMLLQPMDCKAYSIGVLETADEPVLEAFI